MADQQIATICKRMKDYWLTVWHPCLMPFLLLGIPLGGIPKIDRAVAEALSQNNGDFMTNGRLYTTGWSIGLVGSVGYRVEGDVYRTASKQGIKQLKKPPLSRAAFLVCQRSQLGASATFSGNTRSHLLRPFCPLWVVVFMELKRAKQMNLASPLL